MFGTQLHVFRPEPSSVGGILFHTKGTGFPPINSLNCWR